MSSKSKAQTEDLAVAGFYGSFDLLGLASQASKISEKDILLPVFVEKRSDDLTQDTSLRQTVITSDDLTQDGSDRLPHLESDRQAFITTDRQNVTTSDGLAQDTSLRQNVTPSLRQPHLKICQGITEGQKPVLKWLINMCGEESKIITYKMIHDSLSITERAARTHIEALYKKGYIFTQMATRPNSLQPIGKVVFINPSAHLAMALSNSYQNSDGLTHNESLRHYVTRTDGLTQDTSLGQTVITPDRHTYCSSSILNTTTETDDSKKDAFEKLILDDWEKWDLRPKSISEHLDKDLALLQNLLDKTAYVIRQKEGTEFAIQSKIGFLKKCLQNEFCEVDNNFISRKEKIVRLRTEQMKKEAARLKAAKEEEREIAIELLRMQLSDRDLEKIRNQTIDQIRKEMNQPGITPSETLIESYERNILASLASEKGLFSSNQNS